MAAEGSNTMMLMAEEVRGMPTGQIGVSEKVRAMAMVRVLSSWSQKWLAGTYGTILYLPFAVATMRGM